MERLHEESAPGDELQQPNIQGSILNIWFWDIQFLSTLQRSANQPDELDNATKPPHSYVNAVRLKGRNEVGTWPMQNMVLMSVKE